MNVMTTVNMDMALLCARLLSSAQCLLTHLILAIILGGWPSVTFILQVGKSGL